jgi:RNA polymerase sigma-70 factor, ECF subfamily
LTPVWRIESPRLIAGLARMVRDVGVESYHLVPSVRGDLLKRLGRMDEARAEFERAAGLTRNTRERNLPIERARACAGGPAHFEPQ